MLCAGIFHHATAGQCQDRTACHGHIGFKVNRTIAAADWTGNKDCSARHGNTAVGVDAVPVCTDVNCTATNGQFVAFLCGICGSVGIGKRCGCGYGFCCGSFIGSSGCRWIVRLVSVRLSHREAHAHTSAAARVQTVIGCL